MPFSFNGIGTTWYGSALEKPDGSYVVTEWFTILWVPIIPLGSKRVWPTQGNNYLVKPVRLHKPHLIKGYAATFLISILLAYLNSGKSDSPHNTANLLEQPDKVIINSSGSSNPELAEEYKRINEQHFGNQLPNIPIHWESKLDNYSPDIAKGYKLEGLWQFAGGQAQIFINPSLKHNKKKITLTLCHEMVHEYLYTIGDTKTIHGPAFQVVMQRLLNEGAFEGVMISESMQNELRAEIIKEKIELEQIEADISSVRRSLKASDFKHNEINSQIRAANEPGASWPTDEEIELVQSTRHKLVKRYNALVQEYNLRLAAFNKQIKSYNMIVAYPDGHNENLAIEYKPVPITNN